MGAECPWRSRTSTNGRSRFGSYLSVLDAEPSLDRYWCLELSRHISSWKRFSRHVTLSSDVCNSSYKIVTLVKSVLFSSVFIDGFVSGVLLCGRLLGQLERCCVKLGTGVYPVCCSARGTRPGESWMGFSEGELCSVFL